MPSTNALFVEWDDRYSVGVYAIDQQHRYLVTIIRELQEAMVAGRASEVLLPVIRKLVTYTNFHFAYEEKVYRAHGYGLLEDHRKFHRRMVDQIVKMEEAAKSGRLRAGAPLMAFLRGWLIDHILGEDQHAFQEVLLGDPVLGKTGQPEKASSFDKNEGSRSADRK